MLARVLDTGVLLYCKWAESRSCTMRAHVLIKRRSHSLIRLCTKYAWWKNLQYTGSASFWVLASSCWIVCQSSWTFVWALNDCMIFIMQMMKFLGPLMWAYWPNSPVTMYTSYWLCWWTFHFNTFSQTKTNICLHNTIHNMAHSAIIILYWY